MLYFANAYNFSFDSALFTKRICHAFGVPNRIIFAFHLFWNSADYFITLFAIE